jgi:hypothetical protein
VNARTRLSAALERVESRQSDGLVVAGLKHLGLSLDEAVAALERISAAGGRFVSISDGIDLGTPTGRTVLRLLLALHDADEPAAQAGLSIHKPRRTVRCMSTTAQRESAPSPDGSFSQRRLR